MDSSKQLTIEVQLSQLAEFFHAPELAPLSGVFDDRSGVERILDEMRATPSARNVSVVVRVPTEKLTDYTEAQVHTALVGYCGAQLQQMARTHAPVRRLGIRTILFGLIFIGGSLFLSIVFSAMSNAPSFLSNLLIEGLLIAGWVALWYAMEIWLFEVWEQRRERKFYERLQNLTLQIKPPLSHSDKMQ